MFGLAVAVAIFDLVVVAVLAIPVSLVVDIERTARLRSRLRVNWLFGLVDVELGRGQPRRAPPARPSTTARKPRRGASRFAWPRLGRGPTIALALVRTDGLAGHVLRLFRDLTRRFSFQAVYLRVDFGLDDPADTGRLYGTLTPFFVATASSGFDVRCRPDFQDATLRGSCGGQIRARPISLLGVVVGFLCSPPMLRAIRAVWATRR